MKPRYGRLAAFALSSVVTGTTVLGGLGVLPSGGGPSYAVPGNDDRSGAAASLAAAESDAERAAQGGTPAPDGSEPEPQATEPESTELGATEPESTEPVDMPVPEDSGEGRRVVFDEGAQRVWLVKADGSVVRSYPVSGSIYDNLDPGTYSVFSRDEEAWGVDGSELRYMVRFTTGAEAAIGFHNIPVLDGEKVQTREQLGTPLSHGCIRQQGRDAKALWRFAPLGTSVVVVDTTAEVSGHSEEG